MASSSGPNIITNGLVLDLDAASLLSLNLTTVQALVVAGGGGGGGSFGGGGGAGGLLYSSALPVVAGTAYSVTVGGGGVGGIGNSGKGTNGTNSVFSTLTAIGGGGGGAYSSVNTYSPGITGGSGGGSATSETLGIVAGPAGTTGQGNAGGSGYGRNPYVSGGGGGAGAVGQDAQANSGGNGGIGVLYIISGISTYYAGGGGGAGYTYANGSGFGIGGLGGGGAATGGSNTNGTAGTTNTGGGGGGGGYSTGTGGTGGSGIVVIRYAGPQKATGGTITTVNGDTVHTFTTSGTFTTGTNWGDVSASRFLGTITGATYTSTDNGGLVFGTSAKYVDLNTTTLISGTNPHTVEVFYNLISGNGELFGNYGTSYTTNTYWLFAGGIWINTGFGYIPNYTNRTIGKHCICATRDASGYWNIYFDGNLENNVLNATSIATSQNFRIGADVNGGGEPFNGTIHSVKVYNRALTGEEVAQNFNALRGRYGI